MLRSTDLARLILLAAFLPGLASLTTGCTEAETETDTASSTTGAGDSDSDTATGEGTESNDPQTANNETSETPMKIEYTADSLEEIAKLVNEGKATLLDVRSQEEWDGSHVKEAVFLPTTTVTDESKAAEVSAAMKKLDQSLPVYVHCRRGGRAMNCAPILAKSGLEIRPVKAKFEDFAGAGFHMSE